MSCINKGTQASLQVIPEGQGVLWWAGKEMAGEKKLCDYIGKNEKTKVVVKLQKKGTGPPGREPIVTEDQKKQMMLQAYRRQEDLKVFFSLQTFLGQFLKIPTKMLLDVYM